MFRKMLFVCLVLILTACQGGPLFHFGPTPTPFPEKFTGVAQVGPYKLIMLCEGKGEPTIILENGLDGFSWDTYSLARFKTISRTCRYARAGVMGEKIDGPRTTLDQVKDLHSLLTQTGVPGPYILVGHSIAGSNMVLYTDQYPKDVVGLVCVDCRYPAYSPIFLKKLDSQNPNDTAAINQARSDENITEDIWKKIREHLDIITSDQQVLKVTSLGDRPFIVLIAANTGDYLADKQVRQLLEEACMEGSQMLSKLSSRGQIEVVPDVNHDSICHDKKVDEAVQQVYAAVKAGK
jgi:pimeloyl-ACP methyl ester carboxylesterase